MRVFHLHDKFTELGALPSALPSHGFIWLTVSRAEFEQGLPQWQLQLQALGGAPLVDLHVSDLLNPHLPSQFDYTSDYDLLVFRRLASLVTAEETSKHVALSAAIDTSPVGFAVFERFLFTVHPDACPVRDFFVQRLSGMQGSPGDVRGAIARLPTSPDDLTLRIINHMVDGYLDLRRLLSRRLTELQANMLRPRSSSMNWEGLLEARNALHQLEEICDDQHSAIQEWLDGLAEWPSASSPLMERERELLRVRGRDIAEHIERVMNHVRRLEHSVETAVQMHFSAVGQRTNVIMRTLTVLTAIFLPLNLITGFFGMNFEFLPLIHSSRGFWIVLGLMLLVAIGLALLFWRKRYLSSR